MPIALVALKARHDHQRPFDPDDADNVPQHVFPAPLVERLFEALRKTVVHDRGEVLAIDAVVPVGDGQFLGADQPEAVEELRPERVVSGLAAIEREQRDARAHATAGERQHAAVLVIGMRRGVHQARRGRQLLQPMPRARGAGVLGQRRGCGQGQRQNAGERQQAERKMTGRVFQGVHHRDPRDYSIGCRPGRTWYSPGTVPNSAVHLPSVPDAEAALVRGIGLSGATLLVIGSVIGSGIFLTTGSMMAALPSTTLVILAWVGGGMLAMAGGLTYAEMGSMFPRSGGLYVFLTEAYGPVWGFLFGWACLLVILTGSVATVAVGFAEYFSYFVPALGTNRVLMSMAMPWGPWSISAGQLVAAASVVVITAINYAGIQQGNLPKRCSPSPRSADWWRFRCWPWPSLRWTRHGRRSCRRARPGRWLRSASS